MVKKSKPQTFSVRFSTELINKINEACETGDYDCRNSWMKQASEDKLELDASIDEQESQEQKPEPKIFDCRDGNLYHDGKLFGKCDDYNLKAGKIYDNSGQYLGQTRSSLPKGEVIKVSYDDGKTWHDTKSLQ